MRQGAVHRLPSPCAADGRGENAGRRQAGLLFDCRVLLCCRFGSQVSAKLTIPAINCIEVSLRRAAPSFTVEVRRRPRLATSPTLDLQSPEPKTPRAVFPSEAHRLAAVTFGAVKAPVQPSGAGAAPPERRILPSLAPEPLPDAPLHDAFPPAAVLDPAPRARKLPSAGARTVKDEPSKVSRTPECSPELIAHLADRSSAAKAAATPTASRIVRNPAQRNKAKPAVQIPVARDAAPVQASAEDQRSVPAADPSAAPPADGGDAPRSKRKRTIMSRYVFGDELKPGERWKRRLASRAER